MHIPSPLLPPFDAEKEAADLVAGLCRSESTPVHFARQRYLDLAATIVDWAKDHWISPDGALLDPYESGDRWQGGTLLRFICPAAILVHHGGRQDLLDITANLVDAATDRIASLAGCEPGMVYPPGVMDLACKELMVGILELQSFVAPDRVDRWLEALSKLRPEQAYTGSGKVRAGARLTNYEIYAPVGEWLRALAGATEDVSWMETMLGRSLEHFTANGLYRDPGDPSLYDLSVRQNLCELMHYGYDGKFRQTYEELLRRGALSMLMMTSPCGWAPYGGRSNLFLHNECMAAYIAEFEANGYAENGDTNLAMAFREHARRSVDAIAPFIEECTPPHNLKNLFDPRTKHGRDTGYGEYAVYSLLAASLLARTYLVADDTTLARGEPAAANGALLHLHPAFHRTFATCGDTHVQLDTDAQAGYDATGLGRLHRDGVPTALGCSMPIAAHPRFITAIPDAISNLAYGPVWKCGDGGWNDMTDLTQTGSLEVKFAELEQRPDRVCWRVSHHSHDGATILSQSYCLRPGRLEISGEVLVADAHTVGFDIPCLLTDGIRQAETVIDNCRVKVRFRDHEWSAQAKDAVTVTLDDGELANREAIYRRARFCFHANRFAVQISLD
ncbi:MAG: hypothetical protein KAI66_09585 [Lentisphaeria bacterium]|nr:hypothetical protein [Lentisphaeria bacterium]